jgi:predicted ATPase/class 3 adenylate cyclase
MSDAPTGTVTFLFSDIEASTTLWSQDPKAMSPALAMHDAAMREAVGSNRGFVFKTIGDAFCSAFPTAADALAAANASQRVLQGDSWSELPLNVRMGIHTGTAEHRDNDYFGTTVNRTARIMSAAHGGQILLSMVTAELLRDQLSLGPPLRDLGEHRLKGLINPERLWQVVTPGLRQDFPALQSLNVFPNNLPLRNTSFLGREQDVSTVKELLEKTRLLTLVGAGGIGKTSLSLQVAASVIDNFQDGVWFVELASIADATLVPSTVAVALGLREEPGKALLTTVVDFLRNRRLLIVLDNCEHLVDACANFVDAVLRTSLNTRLLASSREPLAVGGEFTWRVPALSTPDPKAAVSLHDLADCAAVQLFVERATFGQSSFRLTDENAAFVAQICGQLDGIPLAIELAAARVKSMRVEQIATRLNDRLRLLTGGSRTALPHQQTLRSAIDWSYGLLPAIEKSLVRRLSVFAGGWTIEAAEAVCAGGEVDSLDVFEANTRLVDKSLIVLDEQGTEPRYRMLEMIRQYGSEKLREQDDAEQLLDRHLQYFVDLAEVFEPHFYRPDQVNWYAKSDSELDNFRASLDWSVKTRQTGPGMRLLNALHRYWVISVYWSEANTWFSKLFHLVEQEPTELIAKSLFVAGHITTYFDLAVGQVFGERCLKLSRALDYRHGMINALWLIGWCRSVALDGTAVPYFEESIELARTTDYPFGAAHAFAWFGVYQLSVADYDSAEPLFHASKCEAQRLGGDATLIGRCNGNLGLIALMRGDFATAKSCLDESLALQKGAGNKNGIAETLWLQGRLALRQADYAEAIACFRESLGLYRMYANSLWVTRGLVYLAITLVASGQIDRAGQIVAALEQQGREGPSIKLHLGSIVAISEYQEALGELGGTIVADCTAFVGVITREQAIALALDDNVEV